jgi:hypothetical protein
VRFIDEDSLRHVQAKLDKAYRSNSWPFEWGRNAILLYTRC